MKDEGRKSIGEKSEPVVPSAVVANPHAEDLTCSEGQVEDLLAEGESTDSDGEDEADVFPEPSGSNAVVRKSVPGAKPGRK